MKKLFCVFTVSLLVGCGSSDPIGTLKAGTTIVGNKDFPLLGSARGGHLFDSFCEGKPDDAVLPPDPRSLVQPGVNAGKAVYFNAHWRTCRAGAYPTTCGEQRAHVERGRALIGGSGAIGAGHQFGGSNPDSGYATDAATYNNLWQQWGLMARPGNFDQLVEERYGLPLAPTRNPYPLPGEDPNATDGGSGQLPTALTQLHNADGSWNGKLGVTCSVCHSGQVGTPGSGLGPGTIYGTNSIHDFIPFFRELGNSNIGFSVASLSRARGTGNITNFQLFALVEGGDQTTYRGLDPRLLVAPSTGTEDAPVWWNTGHRTLKFFDGGLPMDASRIELSWYYPGAPMAQTEAAHAYVLANEQDSTSWLASLKAPEYPLPVDTGLAEAGAILFHAKDLWAESGNAQAQKPAGGNGSCASCHGAYSPRFVNDPAFLDDPALEGIAAYVVPIDLIGSDSRRLDGNNDAVVASSRNSWFAYRDVPECGNQNDPVLRGERPLGYLAPPLYGVWATAPYFHNGSVPNVAEVLNPAERQPIWRRASKPAQVGVVMGFDTDLVRAYDSEKMGWKYEAVVCGSPTLPLIECDPLDPSAEPLAQTVLSALYANGGVLWNLANLPVLTNEQIEQRKIYNTHLYSQSNTGHDFTSVLNEVERRAIIEYLKTL
ncbi:MAG: hypothetical protein AABY95_00215 [Pseudomonadota bacterium]